jgi:hypothetical protein
MAQQATGALGQQATGALGQQATGVLGQQATGVLGQQATGVLGQGTCMMPCGPKHSWKRMRPTLGSTALSGSSSSMMSAREYAALASASLAFCPPAHRISQTKVSQVVFLPKHEPFEPSLTLSVFQCDKYTQDKWADSH